MNILNGRIAKSIVTKTLMLARNADPRAVSYPAQQMTSANLSLPNRSALKWNIKSTSPASKPSDLSKLWLTTVNRTVSLMFYLTESFIKGQQEKQARANYMFHPLVDKVKQKSMELADSSPTQYAEIKDQLRDIQKKQKETENQLKQAEDSLSAVTKVLDNELKKLLKQKIDPKSIELFFKIIKTSSKIVINVIPALRMFNSLLSAYEAAKVLSPNHATQLENYIIKQLSTQLATDEQTFSCSITESFKFRLLGDKQLRTANKPEEDTNANDCITKLQKH